MGIKYVDQPLIRRMPLRPAYTVRTTLEYLRAVSNTPLAEALMTAVTPPDWA
jgi:hypothetical protein